MSADERDEDVRVERLAQQAAQPSTRREAGGRYVLVRSDEDGRRGPARGAGPVVQLKAAELTQVEVEHHALRLAGHGPPKVFLGGREGLDVDAVAPEHPGERDTDRRVVVDDADPFDFAHAG